MRGLSTESLQQNKKLFLSISIVLAVGLILGGLFYFVLQPPKAIADCRIIPLSDVKTADITLTNEGFSEQELTMLQCETLIVFNESDSPADISFGTHDEHAAYPGFKNQVLAPGEFTEIVLYQAGSFKLHNHNDDEQLLMLDVKKNKELVQHRSFKEAVPYDGSGHSGDGSHRMNSYDE